MNDVPVRGWHRGNGLGVVPRPDSEQACIRSEQCWPAGTIAMEVIVGVGISNFVLMQQNALS